MQAEDGFQRFTPRARNVVMAAHNEAHAAGHAEILPAHLVLGLLSEPEALGAQALVQCGSTLEAVHDAAVATLPGPAEDRPELVPYGAEAKKVLELTFREALRLGHNYIGTEHLLLALLDAEPADGLLHELDVDKDGVERSVRAALEQLSGS